MFGLLTWLLGFFMDGGVFIAFGVWYGGYYLNTHGYINVNPLDVFLDYASQFGTFMVDYDILGRPLDYIVYIIKNLVVGQYS
jgi:hypothetical protein